MILHKASDPSFSPLDSKHVQPNDFGFHRFWTVTVAWSSCEILPAESLDLLRKMAPNMLPISWVSTWDVWLRDHLYIGCYDAHVNIIIESYVYICRIESYDIKSTHFAHMHHNTSSNMDAFACFDSVCEISNVSPTWSTLMKLVDSIFFGHLHFLLCPQKKCASPVCHIVLMGIRSTIFLTSGTMCSQ